MSWRFTVDGGEPLQVHHVTEIRGTLAGILIGAGVQPGMANSYGRLAMEIAWQAEKDRRMNLRAEPFSYEQWAPGDKTILIESDDVPEDSDVRCDGGGGEAGRAVEHLPSRRS